MLVGLVISPLSVTSNVKLREISGLATTVTVIVVVPRPLARTRPFSFTVATVSSELLNSTSCFAVSGKTSKVMEKEMCIRDRRYSFDFYRIGGNTR